MLTNTSRYLSCITLIATIVLLACPSTVTAQSPPTGLISVNRLGNGSGNAPALNNALSFSADGRYVAFVSEASDLAVNEANNARDVFVRDRQSGQTILVSANATGTGTGNGYSRSPRITPDGRYVAFMSASSNLVTDDAAVSIHEDVYVRDLLTGTTTLVSRNFGGTARGNGLSGGNTTLGISADGRFVTFTSFATDLVATADNNHQSDVFVRDLQTRTTTLVSVNRNGNGPGSNVSDSSVITPDGRFIVFLSQARDLISFDTGFSRQVFIRDLQTGTTNLVSPNRLGTSGGTGGIDARNSNDMTVSPDARFVAFTSESSDLVDNDTNNAQDVFVRDTHLGITQLVSVAASGAASGNRPSGQLAMTPDGHFVVFLSAADNLVANIDNNLQHDVFIRDLRANTTELVSVNRTGVAGGNGYSNDSLLLSFQRPAISDDGRYVSFTSSASDLTSAKDTNGGNPNGSQLDVFVRDRHLGTTAPVSVNYSGSDTGQGISSYTAIARDGRSIFYFSGASDLVSYDTNGGIQDLFVFVNVPEPNQVRFKTAASTSSENAGSVNVVVSLGGPAIAPVSINYSSVDGTAIASTDYVPTSGTITFAPGETEKTFSVSLTNDTLDENTETVILRISSTNNGVPLGEPNISVLNIEDDDPAPTLKISDSRVPEGGTGTVYAIFTISLSAPSGRSVSAQVETRPGTATAGVDYQAISGQLIFSPGETSRQIAVPVKGDTEVEPDETFTINLTNPVGANAGTAGTGTITNDDPGTQFNISGRVDDPSTGGIGGVTITLHLDQAGTTLTTQTDTNGNYAFINLPFGQNRVMLTPSKAGLNFSPPSSGIVSTSSLDGNNTINFAAGTPYIANLTGAQVVPPTNSNGVGHGIITLSRDETKALVDLNFGALSGSLTQAHIHFSAGPGVNGPILFTLPRGVFRNQLIPMTPAHVQLLKAGQLYFDLHTSLFSGGELRGQITALHTQTVQLSAATYSVSEGDGRATLTVTRTGDTTGIATVDYQTIDTDTFTVGCADAVNNAGGAYGRCDFATTIGKLSFAAGEINKTITVPIINDGRVEGAETFQLQLSNVTGTGTTLGAQDVAVVTIMDNDAAGAPNPSITLSPADYPFFVRQHYLDFLSREPEPSEPWTAVLNRCPNVNTGPSAVTDCDRIAVSGAFFGSPEFRIKGFYVFRFYRVAFNRLPGYGEIVADMSFVAGQTEAEVYARKAQLATAFIARPEFTNAYGSKTNAEYVTALLTRYQLTQVKTPDPAAPDGATKVTLTSAALTNSLNAGSLTRAQVLRALADSDEVAAVEYNSAFVASQYYGYLRRTPEVSGYQAWLKVINEDPNNVRIMVNGFINSTEYRLRFGQP